MNANNVNASRRSTNTNTSTSTSSSEPPSPQPIVIIGDTIELSRDERMFLIQKYLDIVKLELFDPGPATVKRLGHLATNSSGMRVSINNVQVPVPPTSSAARNNNHNTNNNPVFKNDSGGSNIKPGKSIKQKFLNIFKKVSLKVPETN